MKTAIIVGTYVSTDDRRNTLKESLRALKKTDLDIIVASHSPLDEETQKLANVVIYDSYNPLLPRESSPLMWFADDFETIHIHPKGNTLASMRNLYNGLKIAQAIGYKKFYFMEYDTIIAEEDIGVMLEMRDKCIEHNMDMYFMASVHGPDTYASHLFFGDVDFALNNVKFAINEEQWFSIEPFKSHNQTFERLLWLLFGQFNTCIVHPAIPSTFLSRSKVDVYSMYDFAYIAYNTENPEEPYLFLINNLNAGNLDFDILTHSGNNIERSYLKSITISIANGFTNKRKLQLTDDVLVVEVSIEKIGKKKEFVIRKEDLSKLKEETNCFRYSLKPKEIV